MPSEHVQPSPATGRRGLYLAGLGAIVAVGLGLRLWGIRQGMPYAYNSDENLHFVTHAVGFFGHGYNPHYFVNPPFFTYLVHVVLLLAYGPGNAAGHAFATHPADVWLIGRLVSVGMNLVAIVLIYLAGAVFFERRVGLLAAAVAATSFLPVFYSHLALNDAPTLAPVALTLYGSARILRDGGRRRDYAIAAIGLGLATATKYLAAILVLPLLGAAVCHWRAEGGRLPSRPLQAHLRSLWRLRWVGELWRLRAVRYALVALAGSLMVFVLANPYSLLDLHTFASGLKGQATMTATTKLGAGTRNGYLFYLHAFTWGVGWVPSLMALAGAILLVARRQRVALVLLPGALAYLLFVGQEQRFFGRWLMPIFAIVFILAGYAGVELTRAVARQRPRLMTALVALVAVALCIQGVISVIHSDQVLARADTRNLAHRWLARHVPAGSTVVVDPIVPERWLQAPAGMRLARADGYRSRPFDRNASPLSRGTIIPPLLARALLPTFGVRQSPQAAAATDAALARLTISLLPRELPRSVLPAARPPITSLLGGESGARNLMPALLDVYRAEGACYVVIGSTAYDRAFNNPKSVPGAIAYYRAVRREGKLVFHSSPYNRGARPVKFDFDFSFDYYPSAYRRGGPDIYIYKLSGGRC
ncbi:MAG TPA: glycosyltransferase family 39 protein [Solirubrobacteraceae bacterium]|nr:glycosyltransferase family 39 protein [Solirubrobacteraceae bacterium]